MLLNWSQDFRIDEYFRNAGWLEPQERVLSFEKAGEGNMNFVARVKTTEKTFIVKQARDYVEKYPQIYAPKERLKVETQYYVITNKNMVLASFSPHIIGYEPDFNTLAMADLGLGSDFLGLYKSEICLDNQDIKQLLDYLSELHALKVEAFPENIEMRKLNHEHIFNFPFNEANGFDLDMIQPELKNLAKTYQSDKILKDRILMLGEQYLSKGSSLIHGDFYPGSWLRVDSGIKVIDPEFSFVGQTEFDLGVMIAHLEMAGLTINFSDFLENYTHRQNVDIKLLTAYCGVEVLRRILGLAQLPLAMTLNQKELLLNKAKSYILT